MGGRCHFVIAEFLCSRPKTMIDENLIASLGIGEDEAAAMLTLAFGKGDAAQMDMDQLLGQQLGSVTPNTILDGKSIGFAGDDVVIEVGLKSEGLIPREEFDNAAELLSQPDVDGALVGGASLKPDLFLPIIRAAAAVTK